MSIVVMAIYAFLSVGGLTCFKLGSQKTLSVGVTSAAFSLQISWLSLLGLAMYVVSFLIYMSLVAKMELSYLMPVMTGVVYILTLIVSLAVFHETIASTEWIGVVLVLCGVILMNIK